VRMHGGKPRKGVTKQTDVLIVGELGWRTWLAPSR
jgi:hypothetical protein